MNSNKGHFRDFMQNMSASIVSIASHPEETDSRLRESMAVVSRRPPSAEPWSPAGHPLGGGDGRVVLTQQTVELQVSYDG
ncbi:hypothetical protein HanXRQr2_Chr16g0755871 [Helianthus annuus]|uniref:Uncharacterized protein n=1 Tax=Helianthus annuus TaxID=4232 RepID=A0A251S012_HELAN|nr:hypothetical protein HanXRQr2_Chr16g0755871 [Helianthus annuus]